MNSGKTAIRRGKPSRPMKLFLSELPALWEIAGHRQTFDWSFFDLGCGRGDDIEHLLKWSPKSTIIEGYDPNHRPEKEPSEYPSGMFDVVTCFYVLNTLSDMDAREDVLLNARRLVKELGIVAVAARSPVNIHRAVRDGWKQYYDGWNTSSGTYQQGFSAGQLAKMMVDIGFEAVFTLTDNHDYSMVAGIESLLSSIEYGD